MLTNAEKEFVVESGLATLSPQTYSMSELDLSDVPMPLAYVRVRKALGSLGSGSRLLVCATEPESVTGFRVLAKLTGHQLLEEQRTAAGFEFVFSAVSARTLP